MMPQYSATTLDVLKDAKHRIIDLRSDTVSKPTMAMRKAMFEAEVGDDVYGEDPTVNKLERRAAELFKKDAAIFLPTGTMGNIIAVLAHCDRRGREVIVGDQSHVFLYEQGGPAQLGGVHTRTVPNLSDGTLDLPSVVNAIRGDDIHSPVTGLIVIENTHNMCGGKVLTMEWIKKLVTIAKNHNIPIHMDGARVFNASQKLGVSVAEITRDMSTVQFCFSKGLGAPIGSMLVGSTRIIKKARRLRKVLGAAMRQVGVLAAPCLVALDNMVERLTLDHRRTTDIAEGIAQCKCDFLTVDVSGVQTNILMVNLNPDVINAGDFCSRLCLVSEYEEKNLGDDVALVRVSPRNNKSVRMVVYWEITDEDVRRVVKKVAFIINEISSKRMGAPRNSWTSCED